MNKNFRNYALIWGVLLVVFNALVFLARPLLPGYEVAYDARFWIAWVFVIAAFAGNLACAYVALKAENSTKLFYNIPLITANRSALIAMLVAGSVFILISKCPSWIAAVVCTAVFAFNAIAVIKASWASEEVERIDEKVKTKTEFVKLLTVDAQNAAARAKSDEAREACKRVYEAVRYSDPMSSDGLKVVEAQITVKMAEFADAVNADDDAKISAVADELVLLVGDRNRKCKALK